MYGHASEHACTRERTQHNAAGESTSVLPGAQAPSMSPARSDSTVGEILLANDKPKGKEDQEENHHKYCNVRKMHDIWSGTLCTKSLKKNPKRDLQRLAAFFFYFEISAN